MNYLVPLTNVMICFRPRSGETEPPIFVRRSREIRERIIERSAGGEGPDDDLIDDILPEDGEDGNVTNDAGIVDEMNSRSTVMLIRNTGTNESSTTSMSASVLGHPANGTQDSSSTSPRFIQQDSTTHSLPVASRVLPAAPLASNTHDQLRQARSTRRTRENQNEQYQSNFNSFIESMQANMTQQQMQFDLDIQQRRLEREDRERIYQLEREERDRRYEREREDQRNQNLQMMQMMMMMFGANRNNNNDRESKSNN
jgi:hypothetical protein